ncbi:hypothetical protein EYR40_002960 [Pleurotus pulmonarius]|nr:hypothetical protein EYR40_002960 [Pleurotus pulmonarius]KAF4582351.1 hypothetical protein EYR38_002469 [Pleurotus pulmonarius]
MHDEHPSFAARSQQNPSVNRGEAIRALLNHEQLRNVQVTAANILIEAFASGTLSTLNDELLRRRAEYHLGWCPNALDSAQARGVVAQTRCLVLTHIGNASESVTIRFAVLGVALEPIRRYLQN